MSPNQNTFGFVALKGSQVKAVVIRFVKLDRQPCHLCVLISEQTENIVLVEINLDSVGFLQFIKC